MVVNGGGEGTIAPLQVLALAMGSFELSLASTVTSIHLSLSAILFSLLWV